MKIKQNYDLSDNKEPDIDKLLDKLIKLQEENKSPSFLKRTVYIVSSICILMFVGLICYSLYKNNLSTESILATFLAFFSIFISVFFYFKADETSTEYSFAVKPRFRKIGNRLTGTMETTFASLLAYVFV